MNHSEKLPVKTFFYSYINNNIYFLIGLLLSLPFGIPVYFKGIETLLSVQLISAALLLFLILPNYFAWRNIPRNSDSLLVVPFILVSLISLAVNYYSLGIHNILSFIKYIILFSVFFVGYFCFDDEHKYTILLRGLIFGAIVGSLIFYYCFLQLLWDGALIFKSHQIHNNLKLMAAFFGYPNKLSALYFLILLLTLTNKTINSKELLAGGLIISPFLFFALSKASTSCFLLSILFIIYLDKKMFNNNAIIITSYILVFVVFGFITGYFNNDVTSSFGPRLDLKLEVINTLDGLNAKMLLVGNAFGSVMVYLPSILLAGKEYHIGSAHDQYVEIFIKTGVLGLISFAGFWIINLTRSIMKLGKPGSEKFYDYRVIAIFLFTLLLGNFAQENYSAEPIATTAYLLLGCCLRKASTICEKKLKGKE